MSYKIEPMPVNPFLEDTKLRLPRFQRKATWDKKQNFELAVSVFQDYPVGVVIINQDQQASWLLDGRQRRNALKLMRDNPVELYEWARTYIGFKKNADSLEVSNAYWGKVEKYLQTEEYSANDDSKDKSYIDYGDEEPIEGEEDSFNSARQRQGLQTLLDLILMVHGTKSGVSKWERLFDFSAYTKRLNYALPKNQYKVQPELLRNFILDMIKVIDRDYDGKRTVDAIVDYYDQTSVFDDKSKFKSELSNRWNEITNSIDVIERSEKIFSDARIGIIRLTNATPLDAQNIFSRINRGGTQLKAEELLSAKPYWNKVVYIGDNSVIDRVKKMYGCLEIPAPDEIVRWDIAATFISRIDDDNLIFDPYESAKKKTGLSLDEISMGFKLLASVYTQGMSNKHVSELERNETICWERDIDDLLYELNSVCDALLADTFFKFLKDWKRPLSTLLGNAITLEFMTIMLLDWRSKGRPRPSSAEQRALQRDARILFDRLVLEYASKTWRGSGDSKMSYDIKNWTERIKPVDSSLWQDFISAVCKGSYNGQDTSAKLLRPVLYYYYVLNKQSPGSQANVSFDVDHIMPQASFNENQMIPANYKDCLANLALLPTKDNISKKDKRLRQIDDPRLKHSVSEFSGISEANFELYSDITNFEKMQEERTQLFLKTFGSVRDTALAN